MQWVTLFSRTGSEIYQVSKKLGRFPDRIVCNKTLSELDNIDKGLRDEFRGQWIFLPNRPRPVDYHLSVVNLDNILNQKGLVTLHGWLRIVPAVICRSGWSDIFNGHPGDIETYPQLKGFNPQEKAFNLKLPTSGSVIHRVTEGVDEGEIVARQQIDIHGMTLDEVYKNLHSNSIDLWYNFLKTKL